MVYVCHLEKSTSKHSFSKCIDFLVKFFVLSTFLITNFAKELELCKHSS